MQSARGEPRLDRLVGKSVTLPFINEAGLLKAFVPPFRFTQFFSPEDTLLCAIASHAAARPFTNKPLKIAELTTGSGLVGMSVAMRNESNTLLGLDVDAIAIDTASENARTLHIDDRCRFECADMWSNETSGILRENKPDLIICNPPYVPEPEDKKLQVEAGAGDDGTAHLMRTIELIDEVQPEAAALSWCSLSDPRKVIYAAHSTGYALEELFTVAIADGEYSGSVHAYLRHLPHAYICEHSPAVHEVAPDGSGRFAYLLMAGSFVRKPSGDISDQVEQICRDFAEQGPVSLCNQFPGIPSHSWILDRWDEVGLRAVLH